MSKRFVDPNAQLNLDLSHAPHPQGVLPASPDPDVPGTVVPFVDASTMAARRSAIARVRFSGIFSVPSRIRLEG